MSARGFLVEEAVEASWRAVTWDGWVWAAAVPGVVVRLQMPGLPADPAPFIGCRVTGAGVYVVGE